MIYLGVDLGLNGGIAAVDSDSGALVSALPMPIARKTYDIPALLDILRHYNPADCMLAYEALHVMPPGMGGSKSNFARGYGMGVIETALAALRIPSQPVRATVWQKAMFKGLKVDKGESKAAALTVARRLWPSETWLVGLNRRRVPHEGLVDAALIAEWLRREVH